MFGTAKVKEIPNFGSPVKTVALLDFQGVHVFCYATVPHIPGCHDLYLHTWTAVVDHESDDRRGVWIVSPKEGYRRNRSREVPFPDQKFQHVPKRGQKHFTTATSKHAMPSVFQEGWLSSCGLSKLGDLFGSRCLRHGFA